MAMISKIEPKTIDEPISDQSWVESMNEELTQLRRINYGI